MQKRIEQGLSMLPFWRLLGEAEAQSISASTQLLEYKCLDTVARPGDTGLGLTLVVEGSIRASLLSEEGREIFLFERGPGEAFVAGACLGCCEGMGEFLITAQADTVLLSPGIEALGRLGAQDARVALYSAHVSCRDSCQALHALERVIFTSLGDRIMDYLRLKAAQEGTAELTITHEELAVRVGSARETVTRELKKLVAEGRIEHRRGRVLLLEK